MVNEDKELLVRIDERVGQLHHAVFGNGRPGLNSRVETIEQNQRTCPARLAAKAWNTPVLVSTACAVLSSAAALIVIFK
jgi:hypothetical protein